MFDPTTLTGAHTWLSLVAIAAGLVVAAGLLAGRAPPGWTGAFLATAALTSLTGFLFPFAGVLPSHIVGVLALAVLVAVGFARQRGWRRLYAAGLVASLYLLVFAGLAQLFMKVPSLAGGTPGSPGPGFAPAQGVALLAFLALGYLAARRLRAA
jgi:phosphoglycerol transferase MdoB-like AlkP superfamily enzyme